MFVVIRWGNNKSYSAAYGDVVSADDGVGRDKWALLLSKGGVVDGIVSLL